jgi:hypothetical protein
VADGDPMRERNLHPFQPPRVWTRHHEQGIMVDGECAVQCCKLARALTLHIAKWHVMRPYMVVN